MEKTDSVRIDDLETLVSSMKIVIDERDDEIEDLIVARQAALARAERAERRVETFEKAIERVKLARKYVNMGSLVPVEPTTAAWDRLDDFCDALDDLIATLPHE